MHILKNTVPKMAIVMATTVLMALPAAAGVFVSGNAGLATTVEISPRYMTFDWHANGKPRSAERIFLVGGAWQTKSRRWVRNGKGSHICSLSGAGQRSRCYSR